jgi:AraC-like DNA-binding protein
MTNYYKYLPVSKEDENWGLCVLNAGCNRIHAHEAYPPASHPSHHYFNWEKGRVLNNEYQVIYISGGSGLFESSSCEKQPVREGSIIILFPGEWHRFKPDDETGWDEYWVGFKGAVMNNIVQQYFFKQDAPIIHIGIKEEIVTLILSIIEYAKQEKTGYQPAVSGAVFHLLGQIHAITKRHSMKEESIEVLINKARILLRTNIVQEVSLEKIAEELNISYSSFRKIFKAYTGIAPGQYLIQLRIEKAKTLLADPSKSIKQVAFDLQFESSFYFSRSFKEKTGLTPENFRKQYFE